MIYKAGDVVTLRNGRSATLRRARQTENRAYLYADVDGYPHCYTENGVCTAANEASAPFDIIGITPRAPQVYNAGDRVQLINGQFVDLVDNDNPKSMDEYPLAGVCRGGRISWTIYGRNDLSKVTSYDIMGRLVYAHAEVKSDTPDAFHETFTVRRLKHGHYADDLIFIDTESGHLTLKITAEIVVDRDEKGNIDGENTIMLRDDLKKVITTLSAILEEI